MERIRARFLFGLPTSSEPVKLRTRKSKLYSKDKANDGITGFFGGSVTVFSVIFRLVNCLLVQTSFVPDEYWQSLEISHGMVFKYGYESWEWREGIRGYSYPLFFAVIYKILHLLRYDTVQLLILLPRVAQALLTALADVKLYHLVRRSEGPDVAKWTFFCQLCSWFTWYCCTRTLTNSMETTLTVLALYYYPLCTDKTHNSSWKYLSLVSWAVVVRPTALVVWLPLLFHHLWRAENKLKLITHQGLPVAAAALVSSALIDCIFYGKWIFVQWNFLKFNIFHNVGKFYGTHPWHWYLTQGFVAVIGPHLPVFLHGCSLTSTRHRVLLITIIWTLLVYSFLAHKEFRFIYPVLPFCMIFCGMSLAQLRAWRSCAACALLVLNLAAAFYTGLVHQRGVLDLMAHLQHLCDITDPPSPPEPEVLFLMPCHSTPFYSHLHCPVRLRFLECPPDLTGKQDYVDEAALFYADPLRWLGSSYPNTSMLPTHVVLFDPLEKEISAFLDGNKFVKEAELFHTHLPEGRVGRKIFVYKQ
ncbi:GPI mannosyltransferase 3 isoform X1 [Electrophorus electricus]|uniref:Mannosyltransferase n=1 Tax=Electrophorus electricus TaxID=8005 RepID=A0A4W4DP84_ELEEL|nr:GPI mannosyltransferase 3 isoform X1 [Electrophorus electricus]